jgi:hypothetical protein
VAVAVVLTLDKELKLVVLAVLAVAKVVTLELIVHLVVLVLLVKVLLVEVVIHLATQQEAAAVVLAV